MLPFIHNANWKSDIPIDKTAVQVVDNETGCQVQMWRRLGYSVQFFSTQGYWMEKNPKDELLLLNSWYRINPDA